MTTGPDMPSGAISPGDGDHQIGERFSVFTKADFKEWLTAGFRAFYGQPSPGDVPFTFASPYVGRLESIVMDLRYVYKYLIPGGRQPLFQEALGDTLLNTVNDHSFPEAAILDLVALIASTHAVASALALEQAVACGRPGKGKRWLQYEAIGALKSLMPAPLAVSALRSLARSADFNIRFTIDVLSTLCTAERHNWANQVAHMYPCIEKLFKAATAEDMRLQQKGENPRAVKDVDEAYNRFALSFWQRIGIDYFCEVIETSARSLVASDWSLRLGFEGCIDLVRRLENLGVFAIEKENARPGDPEKPLDILIIPSSAEGETISYHGRIKANDSLYSMLKKDRVDDPSVLANSDSALIDAIKEFDQHNTFLSSTTRR